MYLCCVQPPNVRYPEQYGKEAIPLIKRLKYDPKFEPAVRQASGYWLAGGAPASMAGRSEHR